MHNQDTYINFIDPKYRMKVCLGACLESQKKCHLPPAPVHPPLAPMSQSLYKRSDNSSINFIVVADSIVEYPDWSSTKVFRKLKIFIISEAIISPVMPNIAKVSRPLFPWTNRFSPPECIS